MSENNSSFLAIFEFANFTFNFTTFSLTLEMNAFFASYISYMYTYMNLTDSLNLNTMLLQIWVSHG